MDGIKFFLGGFIEARKLLRFYEPHLFINCDAAADCPRESVLAGLCFVKDERCVLFSYFQVLAVSGIATAVRRHTHQKSTTYYSKF